MGRSPTRFCADAGDRIDWPVSLPVPAQTVKKIKSAVSAGVMGMDKFVEEVRRGMQQVQQVGDHLRQIIQQVQVLAPRFETVNEGCTLTRSAPRRSPRRLPS